jgi:hypothetical protein
VTRSARHLVIVSSLSALSVLYVRAALGQALPEPPALVAKPSYLALVRAMREDELLLITLRQQIQSERHSYNAECLANLRPSLLTPTIAWAMEPSIRTQEVAEATRFFESEAGRQLVLTGNETSETSRFAKSEAGEKLLVKKITRQPRVLLSVRAEVLDLLNICTDTLAGTRQLTYCQSDWVSSADNACSARYEVIGRAGETARSTRVSLYCDLAGRSLSSVLTELPGPHETIGLHWREPRSLEMLLPGSIAPRFKQTADPARGLKFEYRVRKPDDPQAKPCVPAAPIDEFGWPAK